MHMASLLEEALAAARTLGDKYEIGSTLVHLGSAICEQRDYARAQCLYAEGLASLRNWGLHLTLPCFLHSGQRWGITCVAWDSCRTSLARWRNLGVSQWGWIAECLDAMAMICVAQRHLPEAGRLAGAADALRSLVGIPAAALTQRLCRRFSTVLAGQDRSLFDAAWLEGRTLLGTGDGCCWRCRMCLSLRTRVQRARRWKPSPPTYPANLTAREAKCAAAVGRG